MAVSTIRESGFDVALSVARRRKWIGVVAFVGALSLTAPFAVFLPDVYRGTATILVENRDATAFVRGSVPQLETRLVTIQQELLSRARLSALVTKLNLYSAWRKQPNVTMEAVVTRLRRDIRVEPRSDRGNGTTIGLGISYVGLDAKSAAAVPNTLAQLYVDENTRMRERQASQMAEFLGRQLRVARTEVERQQARLDIFKQQHAGHLPEQIAMNMVTLERLNTRLQLNADDQLRARQRVERAMDVAPPDELESLRRRLADLQSRFTEKHPDVIRLKAQIKDLERAAASKRVIAASPRTLGDAELQSLEREEKHLRIEIAKYENRIESAPAIEQELEALKRDYGTTKESYDSLQKRYEEAQLAARLEQSRNAESFRVLDSAVVPTSPAAPNRMRLLIMAVFFAFAGAVGAMILAEHLDTSFHTVGELRLFTTVPVLASIPYVPARMSAADVLRLTACVAGVILMCGLLAGFAYRTAKENTQLVWMLSAPKL